MKQLLFAGASLLIHTTVFFALSARSAWEVFQAPPKAVTIEVVEPEPEPVIEDPTQEVTAPTSAPASRVVKVATVAPSKQAPPKPTHEPPPAQEAPVDMTGVTLTNEIGSFEANQGSGISSSQPQVASGVVTGRTRSGVIGGKVGGEGEAQPMAQVGDLAKKPVPPALDEVLESNYPPDARAQGMGAVASVRIRIASNGQVSVLRVVSESIKGYGFGNACRKTLEGRPWSPPIDKAGKPVAVEITYTCTFEVRY